MYLLIRWKEHNSLKLFLLLEVTFSLIYINEHQDIILTLLKSHIRKALLNQAIDYNYDYCYINNDI